MATDAAATDAVANCEAMAAVDRGDVDEYIIAYPCRENAWLSVPLGDAVPLGEWR